MIYHGISSVIPVKASPWASFNPIDIPFPSKSVTYITLRHQIAARIRQAILDGSVGPGERLVERTLGIEMGASVTAVREAIIQLEAEGLITKRTNTTTNVSILTAEEIAQSFVVRQALERVAMIEAARRTQPDDVHRLTELFGRMMNAAQQKLSGEYVQHDFAWHEAVWAVSGNEVLRTTLRRLVLPLFGLSSVRVVAQKNYNLIEDAQLHAAILDAIARNDPDGAAEAFDRGIREWQSQVGTVA
jgi:DNA-binding GntR family transcriptional regulator